MKRMEKNYEELKSQKVNFMTSLSSNYIVLIFLIHLSCILV